MLQSPQQTMQETPETISESLLSSISNDYTSGALIDLSESVVDDVTGAVLQSEIVRNIPVIGIVAGIAKASLSYRDRRYVSKLASFLAETSKASNEDMQKFAVKLRTNAEECRKASEVILDLVDKLTNVDKAVMVGKVFLAFMHEDKISTSILVSLCEMIDKAYINDLKALGRKDDKPGDPWNESNLEAVGIKKPMRSEDVNKAIEALRARIEAESPVIKVENTLKPIEEPRVLESGFTEIGYTLRRILQEY